MNNVYFVLGGEGEPRQPTRGYKGDAGWDLYVSRLTIVRPGGLMDIPTDLSVALPRGFFGRITSRSSTLRATGLVISEGIIDNGWRGELYIGAFNVSDNEVVLKPGDRVAQFIIHRIHEMRWVEAKTLPSTERGSRGFGSTGR